MQNLHFKFNITVALLISGLGALIKQVDPSGISLLVIGIILVVISLLTRAALDESAKKTNTLILPAVNLSQNRQSSEHASCK